VGAAAGSASKIAPAGNEERATAGDPGPAKVSATARAGDHCAASTARAGGAGEQPPPSRKQLASRVGV